MNTKLFKNIIAITLVSAALTANADEWTGRDKELHFLGGAAVAAVVTTATRNEWTGFAAGTAVGLAKEIYDSTGRGEVSGKDFVVNALGAFVGAKFTGWVITRDSITYTVRINIF